MKDWIMGLCPEIADWQAELIEEQMLSVLSAEREACAQMVERMGMKGYGTLAIAGAIRARREQ